MADQKVDIQGFDINDFDKFGVDGDNNLYWDRKRLKTELRLSLWQKVGAIAVTVSAILASIASIVSSVASLTQKQATHEIQLTMPDGTVITTVSEGTDRATAGGENSTTHDSEGLSAQE